MEKTAEDAVSKASTTIVDLVTTYGLHIIGAIGILIVGWIIAGWAQRLVRSRVSKLKRVDPALVPYVSGVIRYLILIFTLIAVLNQFGVQTASIIAILGAAGLAVGLALQGTLSNVAAGVMLLFLRPFTLGDFIDAGGESGTVEEIGLFSSVLRTFDGVYVAVPNSTLWNSNIKNYSRAEKRRIDLTVGIAYEDDVDKALALGLDILKAESRILEDPGPQTMIVGLGDNSVDIGLRCWTAADDYWDVLFALRRASKVGFEDAGLTIPFPQRVVHVTGDSGKISGA